MSLYVTSKATHIVKRINIFKCSSFNQNKRQLLSAGHLLRKWDSSRSMWLFWQREGLSLVKYASAPHLFL